MLHLFIASIISSTLGLIVLPQETISSAPILKNNSSNPLPLEIAIIENIHRKNLAPLEEAKSYERLLKEFGYTQVKLGASLCRSRSHITNMLRLLSLPTFVKEMLEKGFLSAGHGRALLSAEDKEKIAAKEMQAEVEKQEFLQKEQRERIGRK